MRIPFPERVSYSHAFLFACGLGVVELLEGTHPGFVGLVFCFILVATAAFNIAGGMSFPSGAFIGANALQTLMLPMVAKALMGESGDANLHVPLRSLQVYLCNIVAMMAAAILTRYFRPKRALIGDIFPLFSLRDAYRGCVALAILLGFVQLLLPTGENGSIGSILQQVNKFAPLAFLLGVISTVHFSRGAKSLSWPLVGLMLYSASTGLLTFSKETFLSPFFGWAVAAAFMRYRLRWINVAAFGLGLYLTLTYMVPYSQVGRALRGMDGMSDPQVSAYVLSHMSEIQERYKEEVSSTFTKIHEFDRPVPLLDRMDVLAIDDALIEQTDHEGFFGYQPLLQIFANVVPHFLWPNKPRIYYGNQYARGLGILQTDDYTTGISFSPAGEAYHLGGIFCILLVAPLVYIFSFLMMDGFAGDARRNPVSLLIILIAVRISVEGQLTGAIFIAEQPLFVVIFVAYVAAYLLPVVGKLFTNQNDVPTAPSLQTAPELPL